MKLERNGIVAIIFVVTFVLLIVLSFLTSGFRLDLKGIFIAVYFSVWISAVAFVVFTFVLPYMADRKKVKKTAKIGSTSGIRSTTPPPHFKSPRSGLPVRERIVAYVAERRREDGLSAPEPLRPSRTVSSVSAGPAGATASQRVMVGSGSQISSATSGGSVGLSGSGTTSGGDVMDDLPLIDEFGPVDDSSGDMGSLPGLDDDLGDLNEFGGGDDNGLLGDFGEIQSTPKQKSGPSPEKADRVVPDVEKVIEPGFAESGLILDDGILDFTDEDVLSMDDDTSSSSSDAGGLLSAGLPDLDDSLDPDMMDSDFSGDEDFGDIEFLDIEPEEPKKRSK
jgi:hypothetical protein